MSKYYDDMQISFSSDNKEEIVIHDSWITREYISSESPNGKKIKFELCPKYQDNKPLGKLLIDFLDTDFKNLEGFMKFFEYYGVKGLCDISERAKAESIVLMEVLHGPIKYEKSDYIKMMTEIWDDTKDYLIQAQMDFRAAISYCYNFDNYKFIRELTPIQRFYITSISKQWEGLGEGLLPYSREIEVYFDVFSLDNSIEFRKHDHDELANMILQNKSIVHYATIFRSSNITNICYLIFQHILKNMIIRKCQNCGKYFIPVSKSDEIFCERIYDGKTCRGIGPGKKRSEKIKNDPILKEYYRAYKRIYARRMSKKLSPNDFINWADRVKMVMQQAREGQITLEEFKKWLKDN